MGLPLEDFFDIRPPAEPSFSAQPPAPKSYDEGLADGRAQAESEFDTERQAALQTIAQSMSDLAIGYADARAAVLDQLGPLFHSLVDVLLPELAQLSFREQLLQLLNDAAEQDGARPATLRVSHIVDSDIAAFLESQGITDVILEQDQTLQDGQALLTTGQGETMLDVERARQEIHRAFQSLTDPENRNLRHG